MCEVLTKNIEPLYFNIKNTKIKHDPKMDMETRRSLIAKREDFSVMKLKTSAPEGRNQ